MRYEIESESGEFDCACISKDISYQSNAKTCYGVDFNIYHPKQNLYLNSKHVV